MKLVLLIAVSTVVGHRDDASLSETSTSSEEAPVVTKFRRSNHAHKPSWQYEGLPIEFPARRNMESNELDQSDSELSTAKINTLKTTQPTKVTRTTTLPTSTVPSPPLDRRYRRIFNPDETADAEDFPFMAALLVNFELWCGAVIISTDSVLTAAHCLQLQYNNRFFREYVKMLTVRVGSSNATSGGELYRVSEIFFHPNYKPQTLEFNVALVKVHKNMTFGKSEPKIDMIEYSREKTIPVDSSIMFLGWGAVIGYGGTGGQVLLQKVMLPVYDIADCQEVYGRELVSRNNFCAGFITLPKNVCNFKIRPLTKAAPLCIYMFQHDAGGPAFMNGKLVGILSFSSKRCDQVDQPAVFTTVGVIVPWLEGLTESTVKLRNTVLKA